MSAPDPEPPTPQRKGARIQSWRDQAAFVLRVIQVRLRFFLVLGAIFLTLAGWQWLQRGRDWALARWGGAAFSEAGVSPDTEYFCPMCPGVLSNWPEKCPVCKMPLVRRRKGEAALLPEGVIARMQLSPYRLQLAGIQTAPVTYETLEQCWSCWGRVVDSADFEAAQILCELSSADAELVQVGQRVALNSERLGSGSEVTGVVAAIASRVARPGGPIEIRIEATNHRSLLRPGDVVRIDWRIPLADMEPFRSQPRDPPPLAEGDLRQLYLCYDHPRYLHQRPGTCPFHDRELQIRTLQPNQRVEWSCPTHRECTSHRAGHCELCGGLPLVAHVVTYSPPGQVLAVPESAVIDTGTRQTVFVESGPGMFDAIPVRVGPRCGTSYPVLAGLEPGQRVAVAGAFLLDAETRLDPSLAASYFGAGPQSFAQTNMSATATATKAESPLARLAIAPVDRLRVEQQQVCPVTSFPLGSMGVPVRVRSGEHLVYLCCAGCRSRVRGAEDVPPAATAPETSASPGADGHD